MNRILDILKRSFSFFWMGVLTRAQSSPSPTNASAAPGTGIGGLSPDHSSNNGIIKTNTLQRENSDRPQDPTVSRNIPPLGARGLRGLLSLFLILLSTLPLWGQGGTFPVQVIPQALPPAPIYISSYADASTVTSPLRVQIILNDFEIANREIRLKTYFIGSGLSFQSNDIVVGASPLFLEGGIPLVLTNVELAPYFEFTNITGINANQYGNAIPEGAYQFCVEVYDVLTGSRLSNKSCAISVVFQNEPPFLVLPRNKENVDEVNPQYIVFQWTPRSINVSNVEYELSLVEIWDNQVDPQQAFLSSPPVFQTTTTATTYVYGPSDPLLLSGKNYAWRVRAKAKQGTEEIGLFKNEGYSEIYSFSYASSCELPLAINHEVKGSTNANIFWDDFSTDIPEYTVRYRKASPQGGGLEGAEWFESKTSTNLLTLWDLKAGTTYEYQVSKKCSVTVSDWSFSKQFTTFIADDEESVYDCGITPDFNLTNKDPLQTIGDKFTAGDFPIKVIEASGSNGYFTGKGYVTIPYLNSIKVGVQFTNVFINTENQLVEGSVITMYDPSLKNILDIDDAIDTVTDIIDSVGEFFEGDNDVDEINVGWEIRSVDDIKIEDGQVVITNPYTGATRTEPLGDDMAITDSAGNTYYVSEDGQITKGGDTDAIGEVTNGNVEGVSNNGQVESLTAKGILVTFNKKGTYGMDAMPTGNIGDIEKEYTFIKDADGNSYELIHHAVKNQGSTQIEAKITLQNSTYAASDAIFKNKRGEIIPHTLKGNTATLTVQGRFTFENETVYAVVPDKEDSTKQLTAGAFTLWHLTERNINVAIVSVGASVGEVRNTVTDIFKNSIATINFKETIPLDPKTVQDLLGSNGMDVGDSPFTSAYNQEQKALRALAKAKGANDSDTYYVIVLGDTFKNTKAIAGFMPLQRQFGFVFQKYVGKGEEAKGNLARTLAHELGHGVFALQHPFAEYGTAEKATDWLMDYSNGDHLPHTHWAQIHDPDLKFYVFQKEEEGEFKTYELFAGRNVLSKKFSSYAGKNNTYSFLTKAGKIISLPSDVDDVTFDDEGILLAFTVLENGQKERYVSAKYKSSGNFAGFRKNFENEESKKKYNIYKDSISKKINGKRTPVYLGLNSNGSCEIWLYKSTFLVEVSGKWNSGGDNEPISNINTIASGLIPSGGGQFAAFPPLNDKVDLINNYESPSSCSDCRNGKEFYETYAPSAKNDKERESLLKVSNLICKKGDEFYSALKSQINKLNKDREKAIFYNHHKDIYDIGLESFWYRTDAWELYANKLIEIKELYEKYTDLNKTNSDDLFFLLEYCDTEMLKQLNLEQKIEILRIILEEETFITDGTWLSFFSEQKDEEGLIIKLLATVSNDEASKFLNKIKEYYAGKEKIIVKLLKQIDDNFGRNHYTSLNQILFGLLIQKEGGMKKYLDKYANHEKVYPWLHERDLWIFMNTDIKYSHSLEEDGGLTFSAKYIFQNEFRATDEDEEGEEIRERNINCLTSDCSPKGIADYMQSNKAKKYNFLNFVEKTTIDDPYQVILIGFGSDVDLDGNPNTSEIKAGSIMPVPVFFFKYVLIKNDWTILKRDLSDISSIATSLYAGGALFRGVKGLAKVVAIGTLFFNNTNALVMTPNVRAWIEQSETGRNFLIVYRTANLFVNLGTVTYSSGALESIASTLAFYLDTDRDFGKSFSEEFPEKYKIMMDELNKLK